MITQDAAMTSPLIVGLALLREVKEVRFEVGLSSRRRLSNQLSGGILELRFGLRPDENGLGRINPIGRRPSRRHGPDGAH